MLFYTGQTYVVVNSNFTYIVGSFFHSVKVIKQFVFLSGQSLSDSTLSIVNGTTSSPMTKYNSEPVDHSSCTW